MRKKIHPITRYRLKHNPPLSTWELAKKLGVSQNAIWMWENHKRFPRPAQLRLLRDRLGIDPIDLLPPV